MQANENFNAFCAAVALIVAFLMVGGIIESFIGLWPMFYVFAIAIVGFFASSLK